MSKYYFSKEEATISGVKAISTIGYELGWAPTDVFVDAEFEERQGYWDSVILYIDPDYGQTMCFALEEFCKHTHETVTPEFATKFVAENPFFKLEPKEQEAVKEPTEKPFKAKFNKNGTVKLSRENISIEELSKAHTETFPKLFG